MTCKLSLVLDSCIMRIDEEPEGEYKFTITHYNGLEEKHKSYASIAVIIDEDTRHKIVKALTDDATRIVD